MRAFVPASAATGDGNPAASEACRKYSGSSLTNPLTAPSCARFLTLNQETPTALRQLRSRIAQSFAQEFQRPRRSEDQPVNCVHKGKSN